MCGIFGAIDTRGCFGAELYSQFRRLTDCVSYRGPDDAGYLALDSNLFPIEEGAPFRVFLGHRRLSILDLSPAGHQPMTDGKGNWILFNGEIFNYVELREELRARGHQFRTGTDTEVILRLYDEYGPAAFNKLNGMWAFLIVDMARRRVVVSRDRFSIKPIYMATVGSKMYFASEIKQLLPILPSKQPNLSVMNAFLDQMLLDHTEETFFDGVRRLPANTNLIVDLNSQHTSRSSYWSWPEASVSSKNAAEDLRELLLDSVRIRLRSDVKVGVLLSGGLDSSSIAALAHKLGCDLETYSVISDDDCSEEKYVDAMVTAFHFRNRKVKIEQPHLMSLLKRVLHHNDEPVTGFSVLAQFQMLEVIAKQTESTVLLSGQGADEILLGYLKFFFFYLRDLTSRGEYVQAAAELLGSITRGTVVRQFNTGTARRYMGGTAQQRSFLRLAAERVPIWRATDVCSRQKLDVTTYSVPALTHYEDRNSMAFSLEVRNPFLDHRLVEFAVNLPTDFKIHRGWTKYALRQAVPELPDVIRWRKDKQGFVVPEGTWLKNDLSPVIYNLFRGSSALEQMGVIDNAKFLKFYEQFRHGRVGAWHNEIARVLSAEIWARQFTSGAEAVLAPSSSSEQIATGTEEPSSL
jgi:asparagine synthase (glutamine-hydrolysing)